jgi:hypothetical protein
MMQRLSTRLTDVNSWEFEPIEVLYGGGDVSQFIPAPYVPIKYALVIGGYAYRNTKPDEKFYQARTILTKLEAHSIDGQYVLLENGNIGDLSSYFQTAQSYLQLPIKNVAIESTGIVLGVVSDKVTALHRLETRLTELLERGFTAAHYNGSQLPATRVEAPLWVTQYV